jgi:protein involved in polysaccharide export with SLBB domain/capsular polysaccharide biosynthesis protein
MKANEDANSGSPLRSPESTPADDIKGSPIQSKTGLRGMLRAEGPGASTRFDFWIVIDLLIHRWNWLILGFLIGAGLFFALGIKLVREKFVASAQLLRYEPPGNAKDFFQSTPISPETFSGLILSPDLLKRVGEKATPPLTAEKLAKYIKVDPQSDSDMINVYLASATRDEAVKLLNIYVTEAETYTKDLQKQQAVKIAEQYLRKQVAQMDDDITVLEQHFRALPLPPQFTNKVAEIGTNLNGLHRNLDPATSASPALIAMQTERLNKALTELNELTSKYTDLHPFVKQKRAEIDSLQNQISTNAGSRSMTALPIFDSQKADSFSPERDIVRTKLLSLEDGRVRLANRLHEAELYAKDPPGTARVFAPASLATVRSNWRWLKIFMVSIFGGCLGLGAAFGLVSVTELTEKKLKTAEDVSRVTHLPVLTSLGELDEMTPHERSQWAFRAWTMLQGCLSPSSNHGLVCGITSSTHGEGRSTWVHLLAEAASLTGFRVLTIATRPSPGQVAVAEDAPEERLLEGTAPSKPGNSSTALSSNVLSSPSQVTERLTGPNSQPMVHIPLPGWVWNLERRKQWREALNQWRTIDNLVILVELPPASVPEAVLLGANLPNLLWLTNRGTANAAETRAQLRTLRYARCNLVGALLNRQIGRSAKQLFPRWVEYSALVLALGISTLRAQNDDAAQPPTAQPATSETSPASVETPSNEHTNVSFSIVDPSQRADWQRHLTLGPGDILTLALFGEPELIRPEVAIGPDGRISFLEAQDVMAAGLTIDELRDKLDQEVGKYRRSPHVIITPVAFRSKKYYMLGKVTTKGVYVLDRPITVLEAIARAKGLENGLVDRNVVDLADFSRSFLMRGGKRYSLNFERLFQQGDLSQNIAIEPGDYIFFAPGDVKEVYVVGEVRLAGPVTYTPNMTIIAAITARGGFSERGYRKRVLVVRGSLNNPQTFAVDTHAILNGKGLDFKLKPKDIIYVSPRPFILVEELADLATTAFIQSLITEWVGVDVVKPIQ